MPLRPNKPCNKPGCPNLTRDKYCEEHLELGIRQFNFTKEQKQEFDKKRSKSPARKLYDHKWREYSKEFLKRNPVCTVCGNKSEVTDHVIAHKGNKGLFWTKFNHMALCKSCHDRKTWTQDRGN